MHPHEYVVAGFFQCIKLLIPLLSTYMMGLVFCFSLFFFPWDEEAGTEVN